MVLTALAATVTLGISMNVFGFLGLGGTRWKEEVLCHDGGMIVVERWVKRGGGHEIGQQPPIREQSLAFVLLTAREPLVWKSEFSEDVGYADLKPILLDIVRGIPYLVTTPVGCLSYNKWKRPNPPYILFKFQSNRWQQIALTELPAELRVPNLIISSPDNDVEQLGKSLVSASDIAKLNSSLTQPQYQSIVREPLTADPFGCPEMVYYKGAWVGPGDSIGKRMMDRRSGQQDGNDGQKSDNREER
jgi:hypothetical protein